MKILLLALLILLSGCAARSNALQTPQQTSEAKAEEEIGSFYTPILDTEENRVNNIILASRVIDGVEVKGGETFSFNNTLGARTEEKGYEEARILIGDEKGYGVGGGVCQVSSTLYNAAKNAGMEIIERHNHENEVHYVEIGNDAAVAYGQLDFVFRNISDSTIKLLMNVENGYVYAKIVKYK